MTKPLVFITCIAIAIGCSTPPQEQESSLVSSIDSLLDLHTNFSGVVLAADDGTIVYHQARGFRDYRKQVPLDTIDIFELASVSKQFTAMTIMMLKEEGKLSYDDSLGKYVPGLPYSGITIRHLLTHTSGLPDYQVVMDAHWDKSKVAGNPDIIEYLIQYQPPMLFTPGSEYQYSNTGYVLLGSIAEAASGQDFADFCRERIFTPLSMSSTDIRTNDEKKLLPNLALGHMFVEEEERFVHADSFPSSNYTIWLGGRKGPGRVSATAIDLLKWDQALANHTLVSATSLEEAFTPATLNDGTKSNYGFGWMIRSDSTVGKVVLHTGDNPGYRTIILRYLDQNKTLIVLNNNDYDGIETVRRELEKILLAN